MKGFLVVQAAFVSLSVLGCGGPTIEAAPSALSLEEAALSDVEMPACSLVIGKYCSPVGARQFCNWGGEPLSIYCDPYNGSTTEGRWYPD